MVKLVRELFACDERTAILTAMDPDLLGRASQPDLRVGHGILAVELAALTDRFVLISQAEPLASLGPSLTGRAALTLMATSLDESALEAAANGLPALDRVVGIGGGMAMDMAKYMA
jgi:hypothetical protein